MTAARRRSCRLCTTRWPAFPRHPSTTRRRKVIPGCYCMNTWIRCTNGSFKPLCYPIFHPPTMLLLRDIHAGATEPVLTKSSLRKKAYNHSGSEILNSSRHLPISSRQDHPMYPFFGWTSRYMEIRIPPCWTESSSLH